MYRSVFEYGRIYRSDIRRQLSRLQAFDERQAGRSGSTVFDWSRRDYIAAKSHVGIVEVGGLTVEILPKVGSGEDEETTSDPRRHILARSNLLYMLCIARAVPVLERDLADLRIQRMPLIEALIAVFSSRLLAELNRGLHHTYVRHEENARYLRGKILLARHLRENAFRRDRLFVAYDEFVSDSWLNRVLKAACYRLLELTATPATEQRLREALLHLEEVGDVEIRPHHFAEVHFQRDTERFRSLFEFARLVLQRSTPGRATGGRSTFSLLFPMERLFEDFVARYILKNAPLLGLDRSRVHTQAANRRRWLLRDEAGRGRFGLRPDVVVDGPAGGTELVLDTKWKRLGADDPRFGLSQGDLYQLYAYARQYECRRNVLLYPAVPGVERMRFGIEGDSEKRVHVEFVRMDRDMIRDRQGMLEDLRLVVNDQNSSRSC